MTSKETTISDQMAPASLDEYRVLVLLVDDQRMIGEAVRRALAGQPNMEFHYCANPGEAISVASTLKPTVILQDLVMPGVDGLDLVRGYRADPVTKDIPIIVLSTKEEAAVKGAAFTAGANDYLVKLPDKIELIARIQYHSKAYLNQLQRDAAYRSLGESMERLHLRDRALEAITQGVTIGHSEALGSSIIYANPAFAALVGYSTEEILGRPAHAFVKSDDASTSGPADIRAANQIRNEDIRLVRKDGTFVLAHVSSGPIIKPDGGVDYYVAVHEDVTETRKREELLMEAQKMESVGQLTGGIAHDFNNLLAAIKSNAEDLMDDFKDNPLLLSQIEIVLEAADRGAGLVAQLMAFARKQELDPTILDVNEVLDSYQSFLRSALPANIAIEIHKAEHLPAVNVDKTRFQTAISNIALNSSDAMPNGGTLTIETAMQTLDDQYASENLDVELGPYVVVAITDTGTGMPKEILGRAFVPFFTTKEVGSGTGLGLSMVYGFAKQSGGNAKIYSEVGHGTVVKIYLPAVVTTASEVQSTDGIHSGGGYATILVVEDDDLLRQTVVKKLVRLGYGVTAVGTAEGAIQTLEGGNNFDMVFTDVIMPGTMSGADLVREVQRRWPAIAVLMTSGYTERAVLGKVKMPPGVRVLSKPYSTPDLVSAISQTLAKSVVES